MCVFVVYHTNGDKLWNEREKIIIYSSHGKFDEFNKAQKVEINEAKNMESVHQMKESIQITFSIKEY